jgi:hypothetical protein
MIAARTGRLEAVKALLGRGVEPITGGRHLKYARDTPLMNLGA